MVVGTEAVALAISGGYGTDSFLQAFYGF